MKFIVTFAEVKKWANGMENLTREYKSLLKIRTGDKGFKDLAVTCVALANAKLNIKTTLKTIEPHSLEALISEDF